MYNYLVVGSGLYGAVFAREAKKEAFRPAANPFLAALPLAALLKAASLSSSWGVASAMGEV